MADRPISEAIRALQDLHGVVGRESEETASFVAGNIEAVVGALRSVRSMNVTREADEIGHLGLSMLDELRKSAREVDEVIDHEIAGLQHLLRGDADGTSLGSDVESAPTTTTFKQFVNRDPDELSEELERAERLGVRRMRVGEPGFDEMINAGDVKWAVLPDGQLFVMRKYVDGEDDDFAHSVLTGGGPVIAAGQANIAGSAETGYLGLHISNYSGHYLPPPHTLDIGLTAFADAGIHFPEEVRERLYG